MATDLPIESVSGQRGWEWNRQQNERNAGRRGQHPTPERPSSRTVSVDRDGTPRAHEVEALQKRLTQKERHLQSTITRYERLLAEKNRQLEHDRPPEPASNRVSTAIERFVGWLFAR